MKSLLNSLVTVWLSLAIAAAQGGQATVIRHGTALPSTCNLGDYFHRDSVGPYYCSAANTWTLVGGGTGSAVSQVNTSIPLTGGPITTTGTVGCQVSSGAQAGCLASADWTTFNNKQNSLSNQGTTVTVLHGNAVGTPSFGSVVSADLNITTTSCTNQVVTAISAGATGTCSSVTNAMLSNSSITLNAGTGTGYTVPGAMSLGSTYTFGSTSDVLRVARLGLGVAADATATLTTTGYELVGGSTSDRVTANTVSVMNKSVSGDARLLQLYNTHATAADTAMAEFFVGGTTGRIGLLRDTGDIPIMQFYTGTTLAWKIDNNQNLLPGANDTFNIGSASLTVADMWILPAATGIGDTYICMKTDGQIRQGATCAASSERFKDNIQPLEHGLDWLMQMNPSTWDWKEPNVNKPVGPGTAERMDSISPLLTIYQDGKPYDINERGVLAVVVKALQEIAKVR